MALPLSEPEPRPFDPLIDLDGLWTTELAERYLPIPGAAPARYECVDGTLVMTPAEAFTNSYGEYELAYFFRQGARSAGFFVAGPVNLKLDTNTWIQPDVTVLREPPPVGHADKWVPVELGVMVVEFVSPRSRQQDMVNKPLRCARAGVPYFMGVELVRQLRHASVELFALTDGEYRPVAAAVSGRRLTAAEPFAMDFDPADLLPAGRSDAERA